MATRPQTSKRKSKSKQASGFYIWHRKMGHVPGGRGWGAIRLPSDVVTRVQRLAAKRGVSPPALVESILAPVLAAECAAPLKCHKNQMEMALTE